MQTKVIGFLVVVIAVAAAAYYFWPLLAKAPVAEQAAQNSSASTMGIYSYECDEHVTFDMTVSSDASTITLKPTSAGGWPPAATLSKLATMVTGPAAVNYAGSGVVLAGKGESVTLWEGDANRVGETALNCNPVADANNAPFNWGDVTP